MRKLCNNKRLLLEKEDHLITSTRSRRSVANRFLTLAVSNLHFGSTLAKTKFKSRLTFVPSSGVGSHVQPLPER